MKSIRYIVLSNKSTKRICFRLTMKTISHLYAYVKDCFVGRHLSAFNNTLANTLRMMLLSCLARFDRIEVMHRSRHNKTCSTFGCQDTSIWESMFISNWASTDLNNEMFIRTLRLYIADRMLRWTLVSSMFANLARKCESIKLNVNLLIFYIESAMFICCWRLMEH